MKTVGEVMASDVVWVSPSARVKTAVILMKGHNIGALPVVEANDEVAGIVTYHDVLGQPADAPIADIMTRDFRPVSPEMSIADAAELMTESRSGCLMVLQDKRLKGIISHGDILPELGKSYDPLTGLAWSDQFREWAMAALKRGQEISVIFFDLDKFGMFNKQHGHVVGDTVLKEVAEVFVSSIDPEKSFACRYGGDEFVVVSIRDADAAVSLADTIKQGIAAITIPGLPISVSGSYGIFGGRRTNERRDIHYAATIDDLVTHASKNCTLAKPGPRASEMGREAEALGRDLQSRPVPEAAQPVTAQPTAALTPAPTPAAVRLKIHTINFTSSGAEANVTVTLMHGEQEYSRQSSGYLIDGGNALRLVAEATAGAASKALAADHGIVVDEVFLQTGGTGEQIVTVTAAFINPRYTTRCAGSAVIKRGDQFRAAAAAVLAAVNRQIETAPRSDEDEPAEDQPSADAT